MILPCTYCGQNTERFRPQKVVRCFDCKVEQKRDYYKRHGKLTEYEREKIGYPHA